MPRRIRCLEKNIASRLIGTDDKRDVVLVAGVGLIHEMGDVDAGDRAGGDRP